jgi:hypothetical protein
MRLRKQVGALCGTAAPACRLTYGQPANSFGADEGSAVQSDMLLATICMWPRQRVGRRLEN